jgi:hypothetical protein
MEVLHSEIIDTVGGYPSYLLLSNDILEKSSKKPNFQQLFHRSICLHDLLLQTQIMRSETTVKPQQTTPLIEIVEKSILRFYEEYGVHGEAYILDSLTNSKRSFLPESELNTSYPSYISSIIILCSSLLQKHFSAGLVSSYFANSGVKVTNFTKSSESSKKITTSNKGVLFEYYAMDALAREFLQTPFFGARSKVSIHPILGKSLNSFRAKFIERDGRLNETEFRKTVSVFLRITDTFTDNAELDFILKLLGIKKTVVPELKITYYQLYTGEKTNTFENNVFNRLVAVLTEPYILNIYKKFKIHHLVELVLRNKIDLQAPQQHIKNCMDFLEVFDYSFDLGFSLKSEYRHGTLSKVTESSNALISWESAQTKPVHPLIGNQAHVEEEGKTDKSIRRTNVPQSANNLENAERSRGKTFSSFQKSKKKPQKHQHTSSPIVMLMVNFMEQKGVPSSAQDVFEFVRQETQVSLSTIRVYLAQNKLFVKSSIGLFGLTAWDPKMNKARKSTKIHKREGIQTESSSESRTSDDTQETIINVKATLIRILNQEKEFCAVLANIIQTLCTSFDYDQNIVMSAADDLMYFSKTTDSEKNTIIHLHENHRQYVQFVV